MAAAMDAMLDKFGLRDVTAVATNGLLRVLPYADTLPPVDSLAELAQLMLGASNAEVTAQAEHHVSSDASRKALWVTTGLDAGDGIVTVVSSLRSAVALYIARKSGKQAPPSWAAHQGGDAVLKALGIGYLLNLCFPDSDDAVLELSELPAGRALLAYFAAAEVALPFVEQLSEDEQVFSSLMSQHLDAQAAKLATVTGKPAVEEARRHLESIALTVDSLVNRSGDYLGPFVQSAEGMVPGAGGVVDTIGDVMAAGADVLPVYRYLGTRLVSEAAVSRAAGALGVAIPDTGEDWVRAYVDAPRRARIAAESGGQEGASDHITAAESVPLTELSLLDSAAHPVPANDGGLPVDIDSSVPAPAVAADAIPPPLPVVEEPSPPPPVVAAEPSPPPPVVAAEPSPPPPVVAAEPSPPPPVVAAEPSPPPPVVTAEPSPPPPVVAAEPSPPPPVVAAEPSPPPPVVAAEPSPLPVSSTVRGKASLGEVASSGSAEVKSQRVAPPPGTGSASRKTVQATGDAGASAPGLSSSRPSRSSPSSSSGGDSPSKPSNGGRSTVAIGVLVAFVMLVGCAGLAGLGGIGALLWSNHEASTTESSQGAGKRAKKAGKSQKKTGKGQKNTGKSQKKSSKPGRKSTGKKKRGGR